MARKAAGTPKAARPRKAPSSSGATPTPGSPVIPSPVVAAATSAPENAAMGSGKGDAEAQALMDVETSQGFRGLEVDTTPNENYTVAGRLADKPVPENERTRG